MLSFAEQPDAALPHAREFVKVDPLNEVVFDRGNGEGACAHVRTKIIFLTLEQLQIGRRYQVVVTTDLVKATFDSTGATLVRVGARLVRQAFSREW